jgi:hypothetical protein
VRYRIGMHGAKVWPLRRAAALGLLAAGVGCGSVRADAPAQGAVGAGQGGSGGAGTGGSASAAGGAGAASAGGDGPGGAPACVAPRAYVLGGASRQDVRNLAAGADGSVVASIQFIGDVTVDGDPVDAPDEAGYALVKLDPSGALAYARTIAEVSTQNEYLPVALDAAGHTVFGGGSWGEVDLGGGISAGTPDEGAVLVAKLDPQGDAVWARAFASTWAGARITSLALDASGNIFLAGAVASGTVDFGWGPQEGEFYLAKLDADGDPLWAKTYTGGMLESRTLAVRPTGEVLLAGSLYDGGGIDFGGGMLASAGGFDIFLVELDGDGAHVQSLRFGDTSLQRAYAMALGSAGEIALAGSFYGTLDFGGVPIVRPEPFGAFVAVLDAQGQHRWSRGLPGDGSIVSLAFRDSGALLAAGSFYADFDPGCGVVTAGEGDVHAFLAELDGEGACIEQLAFGSGQEQHASVVAAIGLQRTAVAGSFYGSIELGAAPVTSDGTDGYLALLGPRCR